MEEIVINTSIENEVKIAKAVAETGKTRNEVIADAISSFLLSQGF